MGESYSLSEHPVGEFHSRSKSLVGEIYRSSEHQVNIEWEIYRRSEPLVGRLTGWLRTHGGIDMIQLGYCLKKIHLTGSELSTQAWRKGANNQGDLDLPLLLQGRDLQLP